jgi:hypothetical protein
MLMLAGNLDALHNGFTEQKLPEPQVKLKK